MTTIRNVAFVAIVGVFLGGCALFGLSILNSTQGKLGEGQSVCNNLAKNDILPRYYENRGYFNELGSFVFSGGYSIAQVEKLLGAQVHYVDIKRNDTESVCGFIVATNTAYRKTKLTSQEMAGFEKSLAHNDMYSQYEKSKEIQEIYMNALRFLKYHNKLTIPSESSGLKALQDLGKILLGIYREDDKAQNIAMIRFIHGKAQNEFVYQGAFAFGLSKQTSLDTLRNFLKSIAENSRLCVRYASNKNNQSKCPSYVNEIRTIKNYAESVLD